MATKIARHNTNLLKEDLPSNNQAGCNCPGRATNWPVQGNCKQTGVVYEASVKEKVSGKTETYTGLTARSFKQRWREHQLDFKKSDNRTKSRLSSHIWELKDQGLEFDISWKLLERAPAYNPVSKKCLLCLKEKFYIMYRRDSSTLNKRNEVFNTCRHRLQSLLTKVKSWDSI